MPLLCVGPSAQRRHRHVKIIDMSDQSIRLTLLILVRCVWHCYPRPGTVTGFHTKRQGNRPEHLIHVPLTDQMSPCPELSSYVLNISIA